MKKIVMIMSFVGLLIAGFSVMGSSVFAKEDNSANMSGQSTKAGNAICPVTGDKISGQHSVIHNGKEYNLCCKACVKNFKKDPEKYIAKLAMISGGKKDGSENGHNDEGHEKKDGHENHQH